MLRQLFSKFSPEICLSSFVKSSNLFFSVFHSFCFIKIFLENFFLSLDEFIVYIFLRNLSSLDDLQTKRLQKFQNFYQKNQLFGCKSDLSNQKFRFYSQRQFVGFLVFQRPVCNFRVVIENKCKSVMCKFNNFIFLS